MLSCARFFFSEHKAIELARAYSIYAKPIITPTAIMFVEGKSREFESLWMDTREGHHFIRGKRSDAKGSAMLYKHACPYGINEAERKATISKS